MQEGENFGNSSEIDTGVNLNELPVSTPASAEIETKPVSVPDEEVKSPNLNPGMDENIARLEQEAAAISKSETKPLSYMMSEQENPDQLESLIKKNQLAFDKSQKRLESSIKEFLPEFEEYFLSPQNFQRILNMVQKVLPHKESEEEEGWKFGKMKRILGKILIPDSVRPTLDNAKNLAQQVEIEGEEQIDILELCTGAGIGSMMTWNEMKKAHPNNRCCLVTVDSSPASTTIAEIHLRLRGVPVMRTDVNNIPENFDGVVFVREEAGKTVDVLANDENKVRLHAVVSDHGVGYFPKDSHDYVVNQAIDKLLKPGGILSICSLENEVSVELDYGKMVRNILFNKDLFGTIPNQNEPYDMVEKDGKATVKAMNTKDSAGLYALLRRLLPRTSQFVKYIQTVSTVAKATRVHKEDVNSSIAHTEKILQARGSEPDVIPSFEKQKYSIARTVLYKK